MREVDYQKLVKASPELYDACKMAEDFIKVMAQFDETLPDGKPSKVTKVFGKDFSKCMQLVLKKCKDATAKAEVEVQKYEESSLLMN